MPVEKFVDYLQYNVPLGRHDLHSDNLELVPPLKFYKHGYKDVFGQRYYFGNPNSSGCLVVASGAAMEQLRGQGYTDNEIIASAYEDGARFSRLDLAITMYETKNMLLPRDIRELALQGKIKSPLAKRGVRILDYIDNEGVLHNETVYVGDFAKRGKKGIFRAYDKGLQLGIARDLLARLELEERKDNAHASAVRMAKGYSTSEVFASRFTIEDERFEALIDAVPAPIVRGKAEKETTKEDEMTKKLEWLIASVAPAIKEILENKKDISRFDELFSQFVGQSGLHSELEQWAITLANYRIHRHNERQETLSATVHKPIMKGKEDE